ncbi:hypothetical protein NMY22_g7615 [Coprinellus aureogranulatus]|nr:hypothetical protein NMY22_g7615 [Coprinellus aureogranulatus]
MGTVVPRDMPGAILGPKDPPNSCGATAGLDTPQSSLVQNSVADSPPTHTRHSPPTCNPPPNQLPRKEHRAEPQPAQGGGSRTKHDVDRDPPSVSATGHSGGGLVNILCGATGNINIGNINTNVVSTDGNAVNYGSARNASHTGPFYYPAYFTADAVSEEDMRTWEDGERKKGEYVLEIDPRSPPSPIKVNSDVKRTITFKAFSATDSAYNSVCTLRVPVIVATSLGTVDLKVVYPAGDRITRAFMHLDVRTSLGAMFITLPQRFCSRGAIIARTTTGSISVTGWDEGRWKGRESRIFSLQSCAGNITVNEQAWNTLRQKQGQDDSPDCTPLGDIVFLESVLGSINVEFVD